MNNLPIGYTLCEYIESNGTQWIDTGIVGKSGVKSVIDMALMKGGASIPLGCYSRQRCYLVSFNNDSSLRYGYVDWITSQFVPTIGDRYVIETDFSIGNQLLRVDDKTIASSSVGTSFSNNHTIYAFAYNDGGKPGDYSSLRMYSLKLYDNGILARDYIPCMNANDVYGLYDKVNGAFYASATDSGFTGKWAKNKKLNVSMSEYRHRMLNLIPKTGLPKGYFRCEYVEFDGESYIDTGFVPNQDTRVVLDFMNTTTVGNNFFGVRNSTTSRAYTISTGPSKWRFGYNNSSNPSNTTADVNVRHLFDANKNVLYLDGVAIDTRDYASFTCFSTALIGRIRANNTNEYKGYGKVYSCQIYDNGTLVRDYVPCVSPDGCFGLYDLVTDEFYGFVQKKTARSYTVNTKKYGRWNKDEGTNPDTSKYDGMYYSVGSQGADSGFDIMRITITGYDEFTCYIRSYAEPNFDYTIIGNLDVALDGYMTADSSGVKAHTKGNQNGGTDIKSYTKVVYTGIGGGTHFIDVMYRKDGSANTNDDRGYLLIDKTTVSSGGTIQVIGRGKVILPDGYTNAEYIAGNGNAWFDIGFAPNQDTRVVCDFSFSSEGQIAIFGGRTTYQSSDFSFWRNSGNVFLSNYNASSHSSSVTSTGRFTVDKDKNVTRINGDEYSSSYGAFQSPYSLYLFNVNSKNTADTRVGPLSMFYCAVFDNGEFVRLFVPCKYDGVFGMYDMIEGIFYSSEGSSEFTGESDGDNEGLSEGVFIEDTTGKLWDIDKWDGSATFNSVAVIGDTHSFGIAKEHLAACSFSTMQRGVDLNFAGESYGRTSYANESSAYTDMDGEGNTDLIIASQGSGSTYAAQKCRAYSFANGKKGYLMAAGEYKMIVDNITLINQAMTKINGETVNVNISTNSIIGMWTSTYCSSNVSVPHIRGNDNTSFTDYAYISHGTFADGCQVFSGNFSNDNLYFDISGSSKGFGVKMLEAKTFSFDTLLAYCDFRIKSFIGVRPLCRLINKV